MLILPIPVWKYTRRKLCLRDFKNLYTCWASGMLGHFSAGFTLDTYAHVTTTAQKEAAQTMGNILSM